MTSTTFPGDPYYDPNAPGWKPGAVDRWTGDHYIDPETGLLTGPYPLPPASVARGYQALHDRAIWERRQRYMDQAQTTLRDATAYQQGALGLLQSYRAGGSSAIEAGIYNQVAGGRRAEAAGYFQQAQMTQPLDLLGDLRREEGAKAAGRAERANERAFIAGLVGNGTVAYTTYAGQQGSNDGGQRFTGGNDGSAGGGGGGGPTSAGGGGGGTAIQSQIEPDPSSGSAYQPTQSSGSPSAGQQQQQGSPFAGQGYQQQQQQQQSSGVTMDPFKGTEEVGSGSTVEGRQQGGPQVSGGRAPGQSDASTLAAMVAMPGVDGNFSQESFAAAAASQTRTGSPFDDMMRVDLNHYIADLYDRDPFYTSLPVAIQSRWNDRLFGEQGDAA